VDVQHTIMKETTYICHSMQKVTSHIPAFKISRYVLKLSTHDFLYVMSIVLHGPQLPYTAQFNYFL